MKRLQQSIDPRRLGDDELMLRLVEKDAAAFKVFYDRQAPAAYALARRILGDPRVAEDVTQEAFLAIWRKAASYDPARASVRSWTLRIARNRAIDELRRATRSRAPKLELEHEALLEQAEPTGGPQAKALQHETAAELRTALVKLPRDQRQVIELAYYGGFSHAEIAELLDLPAGTVKSRIRLGLVRIRTDFVGELA